MVLSEYHCSVTSQEPACAYICLPLMKTCAPPLSVEYYRPPSERTQYRLHLHSTLHKTQNVAPNSPSIFGPINLVNYVNHVNYIMATMEADLVNGWKKLPDELKHARMVTQDSACLAPP
jgi:hypothetical protein